MSACWRPVSLLRSFVLFNGCWSPENRYMLSGQLMATALFFCPTLPGLISSLVYSSPVALLTLITCLNICLPYYTMNPFAHRFIHLSICSPYVWYTVKSGHFISMGQNFSSCHWLLCYRYVLLLRYNFTVLFCMNPNVHSKISAIL